MKMKNDLSKWTIRYLFGLLVCIVIAWKISSFTYYGAYVFLCMSFVCFTFIYNELRKSRKEFFNSKDYSFIRCESCGQMHRIPKTMLTGRREIDLFCKKCNHDTIIKPLKFRLATKEN